MSVHLVLVQNLASQGWLSAANRLSVYICHTYTIPASWVMLGVLNSFLSLWIWYLRSVLPTMVRVLFAFF